MIWINILAIVFASAAVGSTSVLILDIGPRPLNVAALVVCLVSVAANVYVVLR